MVKGYLKKSIFIFKKEILEFEVMFYNKDKYINSKYGDRVFNKEEIIFVEDSRTNYLLKFI